MIYPRHPHTPPLDSRTELEEQTPYPPLPRPASPMVHPTPPSPAHQMEVTTEENFRAPIPSTSHFIPPPSQTGTQRDLRHRLEERARSRAASTDSAVSARSKRERSPPSQEDNDEEPPSQKHRPDPQVLFLSAMTSDSNDRYVKPYDQRSKYHNSKALHWYRHDISSKALGKTPQKAWKTRRF
jgi:hypothetical protein